jgi:Uma2 family endonuclease
MAPPQLSHAVIIQRLSFRIARQVDERKVNVLGSTFGLMIRQEPLTCREPDLALCWIEKQVVRDELVWSPPELVVEVISPSETKRRKQAKLDDYASIGVPEAWIVSPEAESVEIHLLSQGKLVSTKIIVDGEIRPTQFPGVSIPVSEIWPD